MLSKIDANSMSDKLLEMKFAFDSISSSSSSTASPVDSERLLNQLLKPSTSPKEMSNPNISLNIKSISSQLDIEEMGSYNYPKISVQHNAIAIRSSEKWGALLTSQSGQDWQLMVVSAMALKESEDQMHSIFTRSFKPICTTAFFVVDPILQYDLYISRACPVTIDERFVSGSSYVVLNEFAYTNKLEHTKSY